VSVINQIFFIPTLYQTNEPTQIKYVDNSSPLLLQIKYGVGGLHLNSSFVILKVSKYFITDLKGGCEQRPLACPLTGERFLLLGVFMGDSPMCKLATH